ncbi:MAG: regulatory protein RecX [Pseudomonadota bacterium]
MRQKLEQQGAFPSDVAEHTMEWLLRNDLISNERFSEAFCRRRARQGYGPQRVRMELRQRGVPSPLVSLALEAESWHEAAQTAWHKRFKSVPPESAKERARQQKYLAQRGFSHDIIRTVIR